VREEIEVIEEVVEEEALYSNRDFKISERSEQQQESSDSYQRQAKVYTAKSHHRRRSSTLDRAQSAHEVKQTIEEKTYF